MYSFLEQAVSTWLNRMFLPVNNRNHNSNGLSDIWHHTPRSQMVERVQEDQPSQGIKDTSAFFLTFLSSWRMSPGQLPAEVSTSKKQTSRRGVHPFHSCCNKIPTLITGTASLFWRVEVMPPLKPPGKEPFSVLALWALLLISVPRLVAASFPPLPPLPHDGLLSVNFQVFLRCSLSVSSPLLWGHQK